MRSLGVVLLFGLFATAVFAQDTLASSGGCGANETQFDLTTNKKEHPVAQPDSRKALIYIIEDIERGPTAGWILDRRKQGQVVLLLPGRPR